MAGPVADVRGHDAREQPLAGDTVLALAPERICDSLRVRETIATGHEATARARALLNRVADTVDPTLRFQLDLVLTDLIGARALTCASADGRGFYLDVARAPGRIRVELVDDGAGDPDAFGEPELPGTCDLELVAELADRWGISVDGATNVWFEFDLRAEA